ncbi:MAG TPA: hypothetical protein VHO49_18455, partial [Anaerolineales bacterium]|nr:hypothetical protein [Anaerolineales bacterium]
TERQKYIRGGRVAVSAFAQQMKLRQAARGWSNDRAGEQTQHECRRPCVLRNNHKQERMAFHESEDQSESTNQEPSVGRNAAAIDRLRIA